MIREILRPRQHKIAVVASVFIAAALTALGLWTNATAERQGKIERTVKVQYRQVTQALCEKPFTRVCLAHAINVVKSCLADDRCSRLLACAGQCGETRLGPEGLSPHNSSLGILGSPGKSSKSHRSATNGSPQHGAGSPPGSEGAGEVGGDHGGGGQSHSSPSPSPAPAPEAAPGPVINPGGNEPPGHEGKSQGIAPGLKQGIEEVGECVAKVDLGCAGEAVFGRSENGD